MIWTTGFVQQNIPIGKATHAIVKIIDHGPAISFAQFPIGQTGEVKFLIATFRKHNCFIRIGFMHPLYILIHGFSTTPILIPMKTDSPGIFSCFRIIKISLCPLVHQITVVIPYDDFFIF